MAQYPQNSEVLQAKMPAVRSLGTARPSTADRDGQTGSGRLGEVLATQIVASGRYGGSRDMKPGASRNPFGGRRERGR